MVTARIYVEGERAGPKFLRATQRMGAQVREATREASSDAAKEIETLGALDIASAPGKFGPRWTTGLHANVTEGGGNIRIAVWHEVPYFSVFEFGKKIEGNPWLWIPLGTDYGGSKEAQGVYARDYPGKLFRVDRKSGAPPLLFTWPEKGSGEQPHPVYFGKTAVTVPQKFHIRKIARDVAHHMRELYNARLKQIRG